MQFTSKENNEDEDEDLSNGFSLADNNGARNRNQMRKSFLKEMHESVSRVSGPVSMYLFNVRHFGERDESMKKNEKNDEYKQVQHVFLFGDEHRSYRNQCSCCDRDAKCMSIAEFIEHMEELCEKREDASFDVFMEFPYIVKSGRLRYDFMNYIDERMNKPNNRFAKFMKGAAFSLSGKKRRHNTHHSLFKCKCIDDSNNSSNRHSSSEPFMSESYTYADTDNDDIGILRELYRSFSKRLYQHDRNLNSSKRGRFHVGDARWEPNVWMYMKAPPGRTNMVLSGWVDDFCQFIPSVEMYKRLLHCFVYSPDFPQDLWSVFGNNALITFSALSSCISGSNRNVHKIAKQYHALEKYPDLQTTVKKYIDDRIENILDRMRTEVKYDSVSSNPSMIYSDADRISQFLHVVRLQTPGLLMDVYLLCRLLRYIQLSLASREIYDGRVEGCSIVYAGHAHISHYAQFFTHYMKIEPIKRHIPVINKDGRGKERCIHLH